MQKKFLPSRRAPPAVSSRERAGSVDKTIFHPCQLDKVLHVPGSDNESGTVASWDHYHISIEISPCSANLRDLQHDQEHLE